MQELTLVKLGGSLITDKRRSYAARPEVIARLAREIASGWKALRGRLIVGHGSGSFGHVAAAETGLGREARSGKALAGVSITQDRAARLHRMVVEALLKAGLPTFSWTPSSALSARAGRPVGGHWEPLLRALEGGMLPVLYGDVVLDRSGGASICSTETLFLALTRTVLRRSGSVRRALWCGDTEGVLDGRGRLVRILGEGTDAMVAAGASGGTDVTGGMLHRVETCQGLAELGVESWILNGGVRGRLTRALRGGPIPGTRVLSTVERPGGEGREA
jgi:isopentenyl phosphate kinase